MSVSLWPAEGRTVLDEHGDAIPSSGVTLADADYTAYYQSLVVAGSLLTYDPTGSSTPEVDYFTDALYVTSLVSRTGDAGGQTANVIGYSSATQGRGGEGLYWWDATSTTSQDYGTVCGNLATGRWKRVYDNATVDPAWFGAYGNGTTDDSAAIQAAINTGKNVDFRGRSYACHGLTASTNFQRMVSTGGRAKLIKNANGTLFASSADDADFENIDFRGDAASPTYTGDNLSCTGNRVRVIDCHGTWAYGRALKSTGGYTRIYGGQWQTSDATATGYDIELGVSGTATLYHVIHGIGTGQATGGIKLVDCGAVSIADCQVGKIRFDPGASMAGTGSCKVIGCRVVGAISVGQSNTVIVGNSINSDVTLDVGTSGCVVESNTYNVASVLTNNGNANSRMIRSTTASGEIETKFGADSSTNTMTHETTGRIRLGGELRLPNNKTMEFRNAAGSGNATIGMTSGNTAQIYNPYGITQVGGVSGFQFTGFTLQFSNTAITANAGGGQVSSGASLLSTDFSDVATVASPGDSVTLPSATAWRQCWVYNSGANNLAVFPFSGDDLGAGINASITLAPGGKAMWWCIDGTTWKRFI